MVYGLSGAGIQLHHQPDFVHEFSEFRLSIHSTFRSLCGLFRHIPCDLIMGFELLSKLQVGIKSNMATGWLLWISEDLRNQDFQVIIPATDSKDF
jgi:hypothetical protein